MRSAWMMSAYHLDKTFTAAVLDLQEFRNAEFERCAFRSCPWSGADLSKARFSDCTFEACDLSNTTIVGTAFRTVHFKECKLLGVRFDTCNGFLLALSFERCQLDYSTFCGLDLKGTDFGNSRLVGVDLSGADLGTAVFNSADLTEAVFDGTKLEGADLRETRGLIIDPERNRLKGARISMDGLPGLLVRHGLVIEG